VTRIPTPHTPLWPKCTPGQENPGFPYFATNKSTSSSSTWSIRHSYHLRTTTQQLLTIHQPLATRSRRHRRRPPILGPSRTKSPLHMVNSTNCRRGLRPPPPHSHTDYGISGLGTPFPTRSEAFGRNKPRPRYQVIELLPSGRTLSGTPTPCFTPLKPLCLRRIYGPLSHPLKNVQEISRRPLRKYFHSPTRPQTPHSRIHSRASDKSPEPFSRRLFCSNSRCQEVE
jgi:hypothetical protein